ncbi:MAG: hypothetical protein HY924_13135 [Elusimicrobia bacterium]|nr:hypothetical protein [Elusimicrobiota bacterium]
MNHTLMAAVLMSGIWLAVCLPTLTGLLRSGQAGTIVGIILLAAGVISPWVLAIFLEAGYVDNGCLGTLLLLGAYVGAGWAARRLGAESFSRATVTLAASVAAPWAFYGGIWLVGRIRDRKERSRAKG